MKTKVYLRVAQTNRSGGVKVAANPKPNYRPLTKNERGTEKILPTAAFAIELDIPPEAFKSAARVVAELKVPEERLTIAAEVLELDEG